ncbi:symmetrical bis(5'-nucleosyl)-tetraphosphatase [Exilibacterium tricleocarpae]|uniref:Bis(5'-nucleosyl)-tetraphosphatase, symmetrical n=1 Tax=Exilibacterium tricleocarpae TaxID=2591008 RepID=A0A545T3J4_9GAMM|nr:symmetrical bis(5'-nucleosyl)-tetraphosphatase [Exilibacterium tricleocarpae]TQV71791.1 symmetrical bis(5'-nucleosyl)-tetraphosphatase [Exilibacterium tricleocarpae]
MATYAVGDLQGCLTPLRCLLGEVQFDPRADRLWLVGDIVNRGPESLDTLRYVYNLGDAVRLVLGNHDLHLLAVAHGLRQPSRGDTLGEILTAPDRDQLLDWLRRQPLVHHDPALGFTMVHAGIPPQWGLKKALKRAAELEAVLRGDHFYAFLATMYGDRPRGWSKDLIGFDRLRVITNYFTRMRFCNAAGELQLTSKSSPDNAPRGYRPWYTHPHRKTRKHKLIFGHWAALAGKVEQPNLYALDTGCVWGSHMTMLRLEDETWFSCDCEPFV